MKRKFFVRNFLLIAMPSVLVVALLGCMAVFMVYNSTVKEIRSSQQNSISQIRESVEVIFSEADAQSMNYSVSPYIMVRLKSLLENGYMDKEQLDIAYMLKPFIDSNVNSKPFLHSVYIYLNNENRNFFASGVGLANSLNYNDVDWIDAVGDTDMEKEQWLETRSISEYLKSSYMTDVISLYRRVYGSVYSRPIGTIVLNIRKEYLENLMEGYLNYEGQEILIVGENGEVLCQAGESRYPKEAYLLESETSEGYGLTFISRVPAGAGYRLSGNMIKMVAAFVVISLSVGMILAYFITKKNAGNVERVITLFELAERGEKLPEISERETDEYSYIIQNVVRGYVEKNYLQKQLSEKEYKLESMYYSFLQSQLGPHFLFNTLKNIFWKTIALTGEPNDASRMIDRFTNVLYYALARRDKYVKVLEEIKMTRSYLEIQKMRFESDFHTVWECEPEVEAYDVIKFVLQPLVDNSITHGLAEKKDGEIVISIWKEERLFFSVKDNGKGIPPEVYTRLINEFAQAETSAKGSSLYNLDRRLTLTYGEEAGISIKSEVGTGTEVAFSIPVKEKSSEAGGQFGN